MLFGLVSGRLKKRNTGETSVLHGLLQQEKGTFHLLPDTLMTELLQALLPTAHGDAAFLEGFRLCKV